MPADFFDITKPHLPKLNQVELSRFKFVVKNFDTVKDWSSRQLAEHFYVSNTAVVRWVKRLGFAGYTDFHNSLLVTSFANADDEIPNVVTSGKYSDDYLKNITEAVRVMPAEKVATTIEILGQAEHIYLLCNKSSAEIGRYCEKRLIGFGHKTYFPEADYQYTDMLQRIANNDLIIVLSYDGNDAELVKSIEDVLVKTHPKIVSFTRADNNIIQNLSDVNFYIFVDELKLRGVDLSSQVSMIMLLELILYSSIKNSQPEIPAIMPN